MNETWGFGVSYKKIVSQRGYIKNPDTQVIRMLTFMFAKWAYNKLWVQEYSSFDSQAKHGWNPADGTKYKDEVEAQNAHRI